MNRLVCAVVVLAASCKSAPDAQTEGTGTAPPTPTTTPSPAPTTTPPPSTAAVSEGEAESVAMELVKAAAPCRVGVVAALIDHRTFMARVAAVATAEARDSLRAFAQIDAALIEAAKMCGWLGDDISLRLLRVRTIDGQPRPLLRKRSERTIAYFELSLVRAADGRVRIADLFSRNEGQWISDVIADTGALSAVVTDGAPARAVVQVQRLQAAGKYAEALGVLDGLPPAMRRARSIQNWRVELAANVSDEARVEAIEARRALFPDLLPTAFEEMSYAFARHDGPAALAAIDALDREVGGDPELERFRDVARALGAP